MLGKVSNNNTLYYLQLNLLKLNQSSERLASGRRINRASDDPAGMAALSKLASQYRGASVGLQNVQDATNMLNIADGAMSSITSDLQRIRELTVQAANGTMSDAGRAAIATEIEGLANNIDRVATGATFNGQSLLDGTGSFTFQIGANSSDTLTVNLNSAQTDSATGGIGLFDSGGGTTFTDAADLAANLTGASASSFLDDIDAAMSGITSARAMVGSVQNQLGSAASNLMTLHENTMAAASRIQDVDVASEMANSVMLQIQLKAQIMLFSQTNETQRTLMQAI